MTKTNIINIFELTSAAIHPTAKAVGFLADYRKITHKEKADTDTCKRFGHKVSILAA